MNKTMATNLQKKIEMSQSERAVFATLRSFALPKEEKDALRQVLRAAVIADRVTPVHSEQKSLGLFSFVFGRRLAMVMLVVMLVVGSGFGIVSASNQALPGEVLYPMKTQFNEPLIGSFQMTEEKRAAWERTRVERRLIEAETLAENGRLGDDEKQELEQALTVNRKTLETIEGREITNDELAPRETKDATKKIRVRTEFQAQTVRIHIEEQEENEEDTHRKDGNNDASINQESKTESGSEQEDMQKVWIEKGTSFEDRNGKEEIKKGDSDNQSQKSSIEKQSTVKQSDSLGSSEGDSSSINKESSNDGSGEQDHDEQKSDGSDESKQESLKAEVRTHV